MKVVCIKTERNYPQLKIGRQFTVKSKVRGSLGNDLYQLISDDGKHINWISNKQGDTFYFIELSEYRNQKLEELGL